MPTMVNSPTLGMERVAREALIVLIETINDVLPDLDSHWAPLDLELHIARGGDVSDFTPIVLETVELNNFYLGHQPSLIKAPVDGYPNVSVMADHAGVEGDNDYDQGEAYGLRVWVELMVKSIVSEEEVNARVQRLADAANICMVSNPTLRGTVHGYDGPPTADVGEVFTRKERTTYGDQWFWQGARLEYRVRKEAQMPSGSSAHPASRSPSNLAGYDIDQVP